MITGDEFDSWADLWISICWLILWIAQDVLFTNLIIR